VKWQSLKEFTGQNLRRVAMPMGGIGTGTVSLGGKGDLRDWEIMNRPGKGFSPQYSFFCIRIKESNSDKPPIAKILEGPIDESEYEGAYGTKANHHGMPRFRECKFSTTYPFAKVSLGDANCPVDVELNAFNPLIPTDVEMSSLPIAVLEYKVMNTSKEKLEVSIAGNLQNFIGEDGSSTVVANAYHPFRDGFEKFRNYNTFVTSENVSGILFGSKGVPKDSERYGTMALSLVNGQEITYRTAWANYTWGDSLLEFWDDFLEDGKLHNLFATADSIFNESSSTLTPKPGELPAPVASISDFRVIEPGKESTFKFVISWNFPNRHAWQSTDYGDISQAQYSHDVVGNAYANRSTNAWEAILQVAGKLSVLENRTAGFVNSVTSADLPNSIKEAALFNLSTLRSQTFFQTADGHFYGWEGTGDRKGSCHGSCTHVWNYEQATPHLFGSIARDMRELEFLHAMRPDGLMSFRIGLPLEQYAQEWPLAAADGQMGCIIKLYREWKLSGDTEWLRTLWPSAKKALEFAWIPGGWDADQDGVMEGSQHNTMDVEYYGPNPQMGFWYLAALLSCKEMAIANRDLEFAAKCQALFDKGSTWIDDQLFNGDYYVHKIIPPKDINLIFPGLRHHSMGAANLDDPEFQLGQGCLVDQLVGQFLAHICGLGYLAKQDHIRKTLETIYQSNYRNGFFSEFNHMRNYVLGEEKALVMASYPRGDRPKRPFPYFNEVMTGFEYVAAIGMIYEGMNEEAVECIANIRERYDGAKRSPFNEAECGHHYARAMASWGAILAWTGQQYDGRQGDLKFSRSSNKPIPWFTGGAYGTCSLDGEKVMIHVKEGVLRLASVEIIGITHRKLTNSGQFTGGEQVIL
jgi:uncharacterized protein (DUF608 family)